MHKANVDFAEQLLVLAEKISLLDVEVCGKHRSHISVNFHGVRTVNQVDALKSILGTSFEAKLHNGVYWLKSAIADGVEVCVFLEPAMTGLFRFNQMAVVEEPVPSKAPDEF